MEEGLFPNARSVEESGRLEEERRLAYVGITRARQKLVLSYAEARRIHGQDMYGIPSRFLREIPRGAAQRGAARRCRCRGRCTPARRGATPATPRSTRRPASSSARTSVHAKFGSGMVTDIEGSRRACARAGQLRRGRQQVAGAGVRQPAAGRERRPSRDCQHEPAVAAGQPRVRPAALPGLRTWAASVASSLVFAGAAEAAMPSR